MFHEYETRNFKLFNNAVDEFFSKIDEEKIMQPTNEAIIAKISQQEKILKNQIEYLEDLKSKKKKYYEYGDFIYTHFRQLEKLIYIINTAKSKGYSWEDINEKMQNAKLQNLDGTEFFKMVVPSTKQIVIKINEDDLYLDLKKTIGDNATNVYNKGKKAEKKIKGTIPAIEKTKKNIAKLKLEKDSKEAEITFLIKKQKKNWYEKFRWFYSSDQFLVIGGRDSSSNETLYKKYLDLNDLVFHTDFPGSPLALIKNPEKKEIPERTINEAADFVASYSRAWKEGWGIADVFYVLPTQISKSPPSKEFLTKGSFIISGKKSFVKNAKTELAISLDFDEIETDPNKGTKVFYPKLITGPLRALKDRFENIVIIKPSKSGLKKGQLAKELKNHFLKNSDKKMKKWINLLSIDEITLYLPNGLSIIKKSN